MVYKWSLLFIHENRIRREKNMDYKKFFEKRNIEYQEGLNEKEISHIEEIYDIFFRRN